MSDYSIKVTSWPDETNHGFWQARVELGDFSHVEYARTRVMAEALALRSLADALVERERERRRRETAG